MSTTLHRIQQGWLGRQHREIYMWWFGQPASDTVSTCFSPVSSCLSIIASLIQHVIVFSSW